MVGVQKIWIKFGVVCGVVYKLVFVFYTQIKLFCDYRVEIPSWTILRLGSRMAYRTLIGYTHPASTSATKVPTFRFSYYKTAPKLTTPWQEETMKRSLRGLVMFYRNRLCSLFGKRYRILSCSEQITRGLHSPYKDQV